MSHYFSATPAGGDQTHTVTYQVGDRSFSLQSMPGVFSAERLDPGTAVLFRKAPLPPSDITGALLDLGCGYGPVACVLAVTAPQATVWAVDTNPRARSLTARNAEVLGVGDRVHVAAPQDVPAGVQFRQIWSNPPVRVGKDELHGMLAHWLPRLVPDGEAWLVSGRHLGADSLARWLTAQGWRVARHASQKGYRVLRVTRTLPEAVVAVLLAPDGRVLMVQRAPEVPRAGYWTPPSGRLAQGEQPSEALVREVREELGLTAHPVRKVWECLTDDGRYRLHWWLARVTEGEPDPEPQEISAVRWLWPGDFPQLAPTFAEHRVFFEEILPRVPEAADTSD